MHCRTTMSNYFCRFSCALIITILFLSTFVHAKEAITPKPVKKWFKHLHKAKEIRIKIHFFVQDVIQGDNRTVYKVAESEITSTSPRLFGQINMIDDVLTSGPKPTSKVVGRMQGTTGFAGLDVFSIQLSVSVFFTSGPYNGSTISISGRNPVLEKEREVPIVGGTGVFRMARGIAVTSTYDPDTSHGILEYTLYVAYYA